LKSWRDYG